MDFDPLAEAARISRPDYRYVPPPPRVGRGVVALGWVRRLESFAAGFWSTLIMFTVGAMGLATAGLDDGRGAMLLCVGLVAGAAAFGLPHVLVLWRECAAGRHPAAVGAAAFVRRRSVWLRAVSVPYWLVAFGFVFGSAVLIRRVIAESDVNSPSVGLIGGVAMSFLYCLAANANFLALLAACGAGEPLLRRLWRHRLLIDIAVALLSAAVPMATHR